jgi:hypothetical protein
MDMYDNDEPPYNSHWWMDFVWIGVLVGVVALGWALPKLFG